MISTYPFKTTGVLSNFLTELACSHPDVRHQWVGKVITVFVLGKEPVEHTFIINHITVYPRSKNMQSLYISGGGSYDDIEIARYQDGAVHFYIKERSEGKVIGIYDGLIFYTDTQASV